MKKMLRIVIVIVSLCGCSNVKSQDKTPTKQNTLTFVSIPGNSDINAFKMATTEVTYAQYVTFLNQAFKAKFIRYDSSTEKVYDRRGNVMTNLAGSRVVKDHNRDDMMVLEEMENPLNMNFITFNLSTQRFEIEDPETIDWNTYFNINLYPNVVDGIGDWAELNDQGTGFYEQEDSDKKLPTKMEVASWSMNFIQFYGAQAYAEFYGYNLPTKAQWMHAAKGGKNFEYATSDGSITPGIAWINEEGPFKRYRGHVQAAKSKNANPYGLYNMGGSLWEWCQDWYDGNQVFGGAPKVDSKYFIDKTITAKQAQGNYLKCLIGGSFNFFPRTMLLTWNHAAMTRAGNDHFGFRVVKN